MILSIQPNSTGMKYLSTRTDKTLYSLQEAAFKGLAADGGLFMPESIPQVDMKIVMQKAQRSFADTAYYLASLFFGDDVQEQDLHHVVSNALNFPIPLKHLGDDKYTLELFHGPTFAFKDVGARFMGQMFGKLAEKGKELIILTATSGDTGSAVAAGFYNVPGVKVVILYPDGKVSDLQESQMTTLGANIHALKVNGVFDDCQRMVKEVFNDAEYRSRKNVSSANSINILRWIPQSFYYFYGYCQWVKATGKDNPVVVVPSGNYGNLSAGMLARKMGLPVKSFVAASNVNDTIPQYLLSGEYHAKPSVKTISNAMDVGDPSNYERMLSLTSYDFETLKNQMTGYSCNDEETIAAIREIYKKYGYISDPHSAVGYNASEYYGVDGFWISTANPFKFGNVVKDAIGVEPELPEELKGLLDKKRISTPIEADTEALKKFLDTL